MIKLDRAKKYLLACSFGPDSMALFNMLYVNKYNFIVAHVNYNLREESVFETASLNAYCKQKSVPLFIYENRIIINRNIEEKCREIRYHFFEEIYLKYNCDALLIAHNEDDNIETYILQKKRKNLVNFYGISCKTSIFSMKVIRPLLRVSKASLLRYCGDNNVPYAIDSSNLENVFLRNKVRHEIVEALTHKQRREFLKEINLENKKLKTIKEKVKKIKTNKVADLLSVDDQVYPYLITDLARKINKSCELSSRLCNEIKKALLSLKPNVIVRIKKDFAFIKEYEDFSFNYLGQNEYDFVVNYGEIIDNDVLFFDTNKGIEKRNLTKDSFPIRVRNAQKDDSVMVNGYSVKVRRLFIDWKMPLSIRGKWPVLLNCRNELVYIPRYKKDFKKEQSPEFYVKL